VQQLPLAVRLRPSAVFESFVAGPNADVVNFLEHLVPGAHAPLVWVHGPAGSGKSHLLQSVCAGAGKRDRRASYLPLAEFVSLGPQALAGAEWLDYACVDDVEVVAGTAEWERALLALYVALQEAGGRLVLSARAVPRAAGIALPDLVSRAAGGAVLRLRPLGDTDQSEVLMRRATQRGLAMPAAVASYLQRRLPRDTASLCAFVDDLDLAALAAGRRLTVPFVRALLESAAPGRDLHRR
jgi:DnaA-homolog protein